jgi:hypothetical protein
VRRPVPNLPTHHEDKIVMMGSRFWMLVAAGLIAVLAGFGLYGAYQAQVSPEEVRKLSAEDVTRELWISGETSESKPGPGHINHINDTVNTVKVIPVRPETPIKLRDN